MDVTNKTCPQTGGQQNRTTNHSTSSRLILNDTTLRAGTGRVPRNYPFPEKHNSSSANLWCRKFVQYIKMTEDLDLSTMTTSKEYCDQLKLEIEDTFLWAIGQSAITEMTKTVRDREPSALPLFKLHTLFRLQFTPEKSITQPG